MRDADADRLPWTALRRTTISGVLIGGVLRALRWSKEYLEGQVQTRALEAKPATAERREEVAGDVRGALDTKDGKSV